MDNERSFVVHGAPGWDEVTPVGPFLCFDVRPGAVARAVRDPADYGIARCIPEDLAGGEAADNASRLEQALAGGDTAPHRDALALGAALALEVTGVEADFQRALDRARETLANGTAARFLERFKRFAAELRT